MKKYGGTRLDDPRFNNGNESYEVNVDFDEAIEGEGRYPVDEPLVFQGTCMGQAFGMSQRPSDREYAVDRIDLAVERGGRYWVMQDTVGGEEVPAEEVPVPIQSPYAGQESDVFEQVKDYPGSDIPCNGGIMSFVWTPDEGALEADGDIIWPEQGLSSTHERRWRDRVVSELAELWRSVKETAGMAADERNMSEKELDQTRNMREKAQAFLQYRR